MPLTRSVAFALVMNKPPRGLPVSVEKALKSIQEDRALQGGSSLLGSSLGRGEETGQYLDAYRLGVGTAKLSPSSLMALGLIMTRAWTELP